jgi:subtilisin family serine protease
MTENHLPVESKQKYQARLIANRLGTNDVPVGTRLTGDPPEIQFQFREKHVLVWEDQLERIEAYLDWTGLRPRDADDRGPIGSPVAPGVRLLHVDRFDALTTLRAIRDGTRGIDGLRPNVMGLGPGYAAPDYVVGIAPGEAGKCPATEPEPVPEGSAPDPGYPTDRGGGEGVRVVVADTGLDTASTIVHPWLRGVTGDPDPGIVPDSSGHNILSEYAGHGTFIAGVVRAVAPQAEVIVRSVFKKAGATYESDLVKALTRILEEDQPDIISMSAGTRSFDANDPLGFRMFNERRLRHYKGVAFVVAAGNDGDRAYFWPAAATYTVSVGALASTLRGRASFSNFGSWVDAYAPGQGLVNAFPTGTYTYTEPPHVGNGRVEEFYGMAQWSGTSFSTPFVAGLIAARMSCTGENGRTAAAALLRTAQEAAQPGVGAVLLPA